MRKHEEALAMRSGGKSGGRDRVPLLLVPRALGLVWKAAPWCMLGSLGFALVQGLFPLIVLYLTRQLIDVVAGQAPSGARGAAEMAALLLLFLGIALLARTLVEELARLLKEGQDLAVSDSVQELIHKKSLELDVQFYENVKYQDTLHRAQQEGPMRPTSAVATFIRFGQSLVTLAAMVGLLASLHWAVPLVLVVATVPSFVASLDYSGRMFRWKKQRTGTERLAGYFHFLLTGASFAKEVRLGDLGGEFSGRFRELRRLIRRERMGLARRRMAVSLAAQGAATLVVLGAWGWMIYEALAGKITVGEFVMYKEAFQQGQSGISQAVNALADMYHENLYLSNLYEFLALKPEVRPSPRPVPAPVRVEQGIAFENVTFAYPGCGRAVLQDVSFRVPAGQVVAVVGENGSGKTTMLKLLARLYDPTEGRITLDGTDIRDMEPESLRQCLSVLFQDFNRYQLSARENVWFGNTRRAGNNGEIEAAARDAGAHAAIRALPQGYETVLGRWLQEGQEISVGQWQKVALARAFFRNAPIVALDEPTSALDPTAEFELIGRIGELLCGRTALVISHRLAVARAAHRIVVLHEGRLVESGGHEELMKFDGMYAAMFHAQACRYV